MISQEDFEDCYNSVLVDLEQITTTGKTQVPTITKTGLKLFLQPKTGDLSIGVVSGVSFTGYLFTAQLGGTAIKQNDKLIFGSIIYEVVSDGMLMDMSQEYEPFYELDLEKRVASS